VSTHTTHKLPLFSLSQSNIETDRQTDRQTDRHTHTHTHTHRHTHTGVRAYKILVHRKPGNALSSLFLTSCIRDTRLNSVERKEKQIPFRERNVSVLSLTEFL